MKGFRFTAFCVGVIFLCAGVWVCRFAQQDTPSTLVLATANTAFAYLRLVDLIKSVLREARNQKIEAYARGRSDAHAENQRLS